MKEPGEVGFGEELRRQRLVREVSLESIAAATKISVRYLEALEKGNFDRLPAPVFTRGFIRAYATYLGLDPEEMVNAYLSETGNSAPRAPDGPAGPARRSRQGPSPTSLAVGSLASALFVLILLGFWSSFHRSPPAAVRSSAPRTPPVPPPHVQEVPAGGMTSASAAPPSGAAPTSPSFDGGIALSLDFHADCWVELFADERLIYSGILKAGESRHFEARRGFRITLGNAAAAAIRVNGRPLPPLGNAGEVVRDYRIDQTRLPQPVAPGA